MTEEHTHGAQGRSGMSRRRFLEGSAALGGAGGLAAFLAACGDDSSDATSSGTAGSTSGSSVVPVVSADTPYGPLEDEVVITAWPQEWEFVKPLFEEKYGVAVLMSLQESTETTIAQAKSARGAIDVISLGMAHQGTLVEAGAAQAIDLSRISNYDSLFPALKGRPDHFFEGEIYGLPYYWGWTGLGYLNSALDSPSDSWDPLFDPKFDRMIANYDSAPEKWAIASARLGFDIDDVSDENMKAASDMWLAQFPLAKTFWVTGDDVARLFATGEIAVAPLWDGTGRNLILDGVDLTVYPPVEGARGWIDGPTLLDGPNPNAAHAWIDFVISPEIQAQLVREYSFTPSSSKAGDLLTESEFDLVNLSTADASIAALKSESADKREAIADWWLETRARA